MKLRTFLVLICVGLHAVRCSGQIDSLLPSANQKIRVQASLKDHILISALAIDSVHLVLEYTGRPKHIFATKNNKVHEGIAFLHKNERGKWVYQDHFENRPINEIDLLQKTELFLDYPYCFAFEYNRSLHNTSKNDLKTYCHYLDVYEHNKKANKWQLVKEYKLHDHQKCEINDLLIEKVTRTESAFFVTFLGEGASKTLTLPVNKGELQQEKGSFIELPSHLAHNNKTASIESLFPIENGLGIRAKLGFDNPESIINDVERYLLYYSKKGDDYKYIKTDMLQLKDCQQQNIEIIDSHQGIFTSYCKDNLLRINHISYKNSFEILEMPIGQKYHNHELHILSDSIIGFFSNKPQTNHGILWGAQALSMPSRIVNKNQTVILSAAADRTIVYAQLEFLEKLNGNDNMGKAIYNHLTDSNLTTTLYFNTIINP